MRHSHKCMTVLLNQILNIFLYISYNLHTSVAQTGINIYISQSQECLTSLLYQFLIKTAKTMLHILI
jgi:hypothetical protein